MSESWAEQVSRLEMMARGDDTWDLSPNDRAAIQAALGKLSTSTPDDNDHTYEAGRRHERNVYVEERDRLRDLLSEARVRLDQHLGMCECPGVACVSACRECNTTQDLVNRIRAFMQGRTA